MKKSFLYVLLLMLSTITFSQQQQFNGVKNVTPSSLGKIYFQNQIKGYFMLYLVDKVDRKTNEYRLEILDQNMKSTHVISLVKEKTFSLMSGVFNGVNFCFAFVDMADESVDYEIFNTSGKKVKNYQVGKDLGNGNSAYLPMATNEGTLYANGVYAVENKGFARVVSGTKKDRRQYVELFDNTGKVKWKVGTGNTNPKMYEGFNISFANEKYIVATYAVRPKLLSVAGMETKTIIIDVATGKIKGKVKADSPTYYLSHSGVEYDSQNDQFYFFGEYFGLKAKGKVDVTNRIGFFFQTVSTQGKLKQEKFVSWEKDLRKHVTMKEGGKMEGNYSLFVHKLVQTSDGKIYVIGEQYKKTVTAGAVLGKALGGTSPTVVQMKDMMILEFDGSFNIQKVHTVEKKKYNYYLPEGMALVGVEKLGYYVKMYGGFRYEFCHMSPDKKSFTSVYTNIDNTDKKKGESPKIIGYFGLDEDGEITDGKIKVSKDPYWFSAVPAKAGYLAIFEYFRKEKRAQIRLEKLDF